MTNEIAIPEKFKTATGEANLEAILKSYSELEKKLSQAPSAPKDAAEYAAPGFGDKDDDNIRQQFLDIGLTKDQAEKVCALADSLMKPIVSGLMDANGESSELAQLEKFFGGPDKLAPALQEIEAFGAKYLPEDAFETLCSTHQGIVSLYKMMKSHEPDISTNKNSSQNLSESELKIMMRDPKYWRDRDPEFIRSIDTGFKKLFS
ncbi:MAG: hypothetical protein FWD33_02370 [Alphaproteobacteria bacterium]|nr:hypothetical protein [Alphaproteobacteria bacterium]